MIKHPNIYFVGGYVRDRLLGIESKDIDLVLVPRDNPISEFDEAINMLINYGFEIVFRSQFYTAKLKKNDTTLDLTIARKEEYEYNGALPKIQIAYSIYEDLRRRDFTINAIAMDMNGNIIDIYNGIEHLRKHILIPISSLLDDPTRIFRGIRYAKRLSLKYSDKFLGQINSAKRYLKNVSFARIKKELELISIEKSRIYIWQDILKFNLFANLKFNNLIFEFENLIPFREIAWILFYITFLEYPIKLNHITKLEISIIDIFQSKKVKKINDEIYEIAKYILKIRGVLQ